MCIHLAHEKKVLDLRYINVDNVYSSSTHKKIHNLRYININNMCIHLPHNKNVHNLRYINVDNMCIHLPRQKAAKPKIYKRK